MITNTERHFINYWQEQKSGPKWKYYLLFSIAWSVVSFLVIFFLTKLFTNLWETGGANLIYVLISISIIVGILSTHFTYVNNERRIKKLLQKDKEHLN
jgi:cation transporter-like permease